jgi:hypothetical protein
MSDQLSHDEELVQLRRENSRLRAELEALEAHKGPVRIVPLLPETRAILPNSVQMRELFSAIATHWPRDFANVAPDEFTRAFRVLSTFHRQEEPDSTHYAWHWIAVTNARLRNQGAVSLNAFLCAVLAWGDIALTDWRLASEGFLLEFALNEFTGRLPADEWQRTLRGEFCTLIDKRPKQRVGDGRTPRPSSEKIYKEFKVMIEDLMATNKLDGRAYVALVLTSMFSFVFFMLGSSYIVLNIISFY